MKVKEKSRESAQVQNKRKKLERQIAEERIIITSQAAIEKAKAAMQNWLSRHAGERQPLTPRTVRLEPAPPKSKYVRNLFRQLASNEPAKSSKKITAKVDSFEE